MEPTSFRRGQPSLYFELILKLRIFNIQGRPKVWETRLCSWAKSTALNDSTALNELSANPPLSMFFCICLFLYFWKESCSSGVIAKTGKTWLKSKGRKGAGEEEKGGFTVG